LSQQPEQIIIYTDGASRGNPGPAAAGFILTDHNGTQLQAKAFYLGQTTNNVAEYTAICKALEAAKQTGAKKLMVFSDVDLIDEFENCKVKHIPREKNKQTDKLVNKALNLGKDVEMDSAVETNKKPIRLGVLISGGGTTLMNILEYIKTGKLNAEAPLVISSRSTIAGVERAKAADLNVKIIRKKDFPDIDDFSKRIEEELFTANVDLVVQGGWLCFWKIPPRYENRVMNIHPALLPSFGGQGMWGHHVHEAVLAAGCKVSGCTVHFCTNEYDKGPIIVQRCCRVEEQDTPDTLAAKVFEQECIAYPQAIKLFAEGKILVQDNKVKIVNNN
jgi:formyltetrahydrofolate-dependent phosphoribosylglycinamide formyltransferase